MTGHGDIEAAEFVAWVRTLTVDEIRDYREYLELFAGDETWFGRFAEVALPIVVGVQMWTEVREERLRPVWELLFPGEPVEEVMSNASALDRFARQLGIDSDPVEILAAAQEITRAARAHDGETER